MADLAAFDEFVGLEPGWVGHRLHADSHDLLVLLHRVDDRLGFLDRLGHGLFAIDVLPRGCGINGHLGVPVIGRSDADDVDVLQIQQLAIVLGHVRLVVDVNPKFLGRVVEAATHFLVPVPHVAHGHGLNALLLLFHLEDGLHMGVIAPAAGAQERHADAIVGPQHAGCADCRQRESRRTGSTRLQETRDD